MTQSNSSSSFQARRNLLKLGTCGAVANMTSMSALMQMNMTGAAHADPPTIPPSGGYKAIVCLYFNGGIDSFNLLTPYGTTQSDPRYAEYVATRTSIALKRRDIANGIDDGPWPGTDYGYLNPIVDSAVAGGTGRTFGLHPRFTYLKQIYDAGHATLVANCGSLVEPIADSNAFNGSTVKPVGLFVLSDMQRNWQTAIPTLRNEFKGWGGKLLDLFTSSDASATASNVYSCVSTAGQSLFLTGNRLAPYSISNVTSSTPNGGAVLLNGFTNPATVYDRIHAKTHTDFASQSYSNLFERTIRDNRVEARDAALLFQTAFMATNSHLPPSPAVQFPTSGLGSSLNAVARSIAIASDAAAVAPLKQDRQVFLVQVPLGDHRGNILPSLDTMIPAVDTALKAFYDFLNFRNLLSKVTLFSISEFGRTLETNGLGSDVAWGGNQIVMGGAVNGAVGNNRIWGTYPDIVLDYSGTSIVRNRGVLIPQTSFDLYQAEICRWFGVPDNRLVDVFPNIGNFPYQGSGGHPVGFLNFT